MPLAYCSQQPAPPAAARPAVRVEDQVPDLAGQPEPAAVEPPAEDQRAADAGAHGDHDDVVATARGAEAVLGPGGGVRVVLDDDRQAGRRARAASRTGCSRQPRLGAKRTTERVSSTSPAAPMPTASTGYVGRQLEHQLGDRLLGRAAYGRGGGPAHLGEHVAVLVDDPGRDLGAADVDPDRQRPPRGCRLEPTTSAGRSCDVDPLDTRLDRRADHSRSCASMAVAQRGQQRPGRVGEVPDELRAGRRAAGR